MVKITHLHGEHKILSRFFIILLLFIGSFNECWSQPAEQPEVAEKKAISSLNETTSTQKKIIDDFLKIQPNQSCADMSDRFCDALWSGEFRGNMTFPSGRQIRFGHNKSYLITEVKKIDYQALIDGACDLPKDLREELGAKNCDGSHKLDGILANLQRVLLAIETPEADKNEVTRDAWKAEIDDIDIALGRAISKLATERSYKEDPNLEFKRWRNQTPDEKRIYYSKSYDLENSLLEAKYKKHPNWLLVENLFEKVRKDVIKLVETFDLPSDYKQDMIEELTTVELTLPYTDPRKFGASSRCSKDEKNAYYHSYWHRFTVCVGYINAVPIEGLLYSTIAHEISHAIDPQRMSTKAMRETDFWKNLVQVYHKNSTLSCNEWKEIKKQIVPPEKIFQLPKNLVALNQCLVDRSSLEPLTLAKILDKAKKSSYGTIDSVAGSEQFSHLVNNQILRDWKKVRNPNFMNAKREADEANNTYLSIQRPLVWPSITFSFVQEYKCQGIDPEKSSLEERKQAFEKSIQVVGRILEKTYAQLFSFEGRNSASLASIRLARSADEGFADWISRIVLARYLNEMDDVKLRRENVLAALSDYCDAAKAEDFIRGFKEVERKYSSVSHPVIRQRRLRLLGKDIAKALQCTPVDSATSGVKECDQFLLNKGNK